MFDALIMAGGRSRRMRNSSDDTHKALVSVLGVSMLERNIRYLIRSGLRNVAVAANVQERALIEYARTTAVKIAEDIDGSCALFVEERPLGTIGAVRCVPFAHALVVVNVDNLTALSLAGMLARHRELHADLTIAAHREPHALEFGELVLDGSDVVEYREKPVRYPLVSSGTYVVSRTAAESIEEDESIGVPALFERLRLRGCRTVVFEHDGMWIDVNDRDALKRAEALLAQSP